MDYTQLDTQTRLNAIHVRIRDIERQYLDLDLRASAPDLAHQATEMDQANKRKLEDSLTRLHQMEKELTGNSADGSTAKEGVKE